MKLMNDSIWLAAEELKRKWPSFIWSAIFYLYTAWMIAFFTLDRQEANYNPVELVVTAATFNFFVFAILQNLGFPLYRRYFTYWKKDSFTKQLAYLKQLPIGTDVIVRARNIQFVTMVLMMSSFIFIVYYFIMMNSRLPKLDIVDYVAFAAFWAGYAVIVGSLNIYWELGVSGKAYFRNCLWMIAVYAMLSIGVWAWLGESVWKASINGVQKYGYLPAIIAWIVGILCLIISGNRLKMKLNQRDLHGS